MTVAVYQIRYGEDVVGAFDPAFITYDCRANPEPEKRETAHMLRFYDEGAWRRGGAEHFGLVSPKFAGKARLGGTAFVDWVEANPGYDLYFINPFPQVSYWHFNVWTQGEFWHPGLGEIADALFAAAGHSIRVESLPRNTAATLLYSNYWVGNEKFWRAYMPFVRKMAVAVDDLGASDREKLFGLAPHYAPATYFAFVFERLFSTFLVLHEEVAGLPYPHSRDDMRGRCDNDMERFIIDEWSGMIDAWDAAGRSDAEYRKLFANLEGMLRVYQSVAPRVEGADQAIDTRLIGRLKRALDQARGR